MIGGRIAVHFGLIDGGVLLGLLVAVTVLVRRRGYFYSIHLVGPGGVTLYAPSSKYYLRQ